MNSRFPSLAKAFLLILGVFCWSSSAFSDEPVEKTLYGRACLRIEARIQPWEVPAPTIEKLEPALAKAGVRARWIEVVDKGGSALVENPYLPCPHSAEIAAKNEKLLTRWVDEIHRTGMAAMSWYPLSFNAHANKLYPDWRQVSILPWPAPGLETIPCCFNSPYGDALIEYCNWAIERFKLDGIWFDGSVWTPIWQTPYPLTCRCAACQKKFKTETGLEIPEQVDWGNPAFRKWVAWRYKEFGGYIGRLSKAIREKHPYAAVVINHYHRPYTSWHSAVPLDKYAADIISGSEAFTPETIDLTTRLCRAYGRSQAEVWRGFDVGPNPETGVEHLLQHSLICYAAGGHPSFGYDPFAGQDENAVAAAAMMAPIMEAIHPYVGGNSLPYCALHVSQQSETFFFGPVQGRGWTSDPYFEALGNWTTGFGKAHMPPDYVYDADFMPNVLSRYKLLLMPLSMALSEAQAVTAVEYVRSGGTLLLGPGAGQCDADGLPRADNPLTKAFGFSFEKAVSPLAEKFEVLQIFDAAGKQIQAIPDRHAGIRLTAPEWTVLYREGNGGDAPPTMASRPFGQGRVMVMSFDSAQLLGSVPLSGGDTRLEVVSETAASGKHSLKFTDGPNVPQSFYPDLETRVFPFETPDYVGGSVQFDLKVENTASLIVDIRSDQAPVNGPQLTVEPNGRVSLHGYVLGELPFGEWCQVAISYEFASEGKPSTYRATIALPGGKKLESPPIATSMADYHRTDMVVIYGHGAAPATFYLDNLEISARKADGSRVVVCREGFEAGSEALAPPKQLTANIAEMLSQVVPPPIAVQAPPEVRTGFFEADGGRVLVHLYDHNGQRRDWQQPSGPAIVLRGNLPIREATLAIGNRPLEIRRQADGWEIPVPSIGLYQVIELKR